MLNANHASCVRMLGIHTPFLQVSHHNTDHERLQMVINDRIQYEMTWNDIVEEAAVVAHIVFGPGRAADNGILPVWGH